MMNTMSRMGLTLSRNVAEHIWLICPLTHASRTSRIGAINKHWHPFLRGRRKKDSQ